MKKSQVKYSRRYLPHRYPKTYKEKKEISWKRRILFLWILFLILVLAYLLFFSPIFEIKEIKISGNRTINQEEIQGLLDNFRFKKALIFFDQDNIFLATKNKLSSILIGEFPRILLLEINKNIFKRTVELKIVERKEAGILCKMWEVGLPTGSPTSNIENCYYVDENGIIFKSAPQTSGTLILVIKDYSGEEAEIGKNVIEREFLTKLIDLRNYLSNQLSLKVLDFVIEPSPLKDFKINTNEGWYILLDGMRDFKNQLEALRLVLEEKDKGDRGSLEYVDLRIENRVYYKQSF